MLQRTLFASGECNSSHFWRLSKYATSEVRERIENRLLTRAAPIRAATVTERLP
jgi:hypothetical protein